MSEIRSREWGRGDSSRVLGNQRGLTLVETMVATIVAVLAVVGLAYSFGVGHGLIDRYQIARAALGEAQGVLDRLVEQPPATLADGSQAFTPFGAPAGTIVWAVTPVDDPADLLSPSDPDPVDLKRIRVRATWGFGGSQDSLSLVRLVSAR